ncbi:hypothetical protein UFOVP275_35 [uncultured Caudovirales phage]|uniref:Uncharacterized protein n=1 Tax=uncultured Caudovirales phage TaxID=2100421 RepID=A0A6J5LPK8_9CAUD|nr:hypothetical protein UFOVP275_35 [uncultured Caudovirales phage]
MAKITTRAGLNVGTELTIDETLRTFTLNVAGNLVAKDGVTLQVVWSKFVDLWATAPYQDSPFPMNAIDALSGQYSFGVDPGGIYNGWKPANDATRQMLRDGGWNEYSSAGVLNRQYAGIVGLGVVSSGAQLYYQRATSDAPSNFTFTDQCNEGIQIYGDAGNGNFDKRTYFKGFVREYQKKYKDSVLSDTGKTATGAYLVNLLLSNETDLDVTVADASITASPYSEINVKYFAAAFSKDIDTTGSARDFGIVVDVGTHSGVDGVSNGTTTFTTAAAGITGANYTGGTLIVHEGAGKGTYTISGTPTSTSITTTVAVTGSASNLSFTLQRAAPVSATLQQIYTKIQYQLRQNSNINGLASAGSVTGKTASILLNFVGSALKAGFFAPTNPNGGGTGVTIMGFAASDTNSFTSYDNTAAARDYPYASAGVISFNSPLVGSGSSYRLMFSAPPGAGNDYGEAGAVTVNDAAGSPITGTISSGSISFTYDYDGNVQSGFTAATDRPVTLIGIKPGTGKFVAATGTLTRSKAISLSLVAEVDRVYA